MTSRLSIEVVVDHARRIWAVIYEIEQRRALLNRPWEEEFLHWARDEHGWHLHGHLTPGKHTHSITSTGWCPGLLGRPH